MTDTNSNPILSAALRYAENNIHVFPVNIGIRGDGKKDVYPIAAWKEASTTDPVKIKEWFTGAWRGAALACDTGKSGIVVIDQDISDGKNGPDEWAQVGQISEVRQRTGSGGVHDFFLADPDNPVTVANRGEVADGVDVRGIGGFAFLPPSIDPRGGQWEWIGGEPEWKEFWTELPTVPLIVPERLNAARSRLRSKPETASASGSDQLFASPSDLIDFGPDGGYKTPDAAGALLDRELEKFTALQKPGSGRSHILAQSLGVLAGHGVPRFWTYELALNALLQACEANGFTAEHGAAYAEQQARRGLDYGMTEPWHVRAVSAVSRADAAAAFGHAETSTPLPPSQDAAQELVDALLAKMLSPAQMAEMPPPKPLVKGLLDLDSLCWIIGAPGSFKSFVSLDLAAHVGTGLPWRGMAVTQGPVVYIAAEGTRGMGKRVRAWEKQYGHMGDVRFLPMPIKVKDPVAWQTLVEACRQIAPVMVVIDTQARVTAGVEENSNTEMGVAIEAFDAIKAATGGCVLIVHHTGRNGQDARGASAIDGAQDTELKLSRQEPRSSMVVKLNEDKQKDMAEASEGIVLRLVEEVLNEPGEERLTSLRVAGAFEELAGTGEEPPLEIDVAPWKGKEPEKWTGQVVAPQSTVKRRILQVLHDHAHGRGLTRTDALKVITDRWNAPAVSGWIDSWNAVTDLDCVINVGGERFAVDPVGLDQN